MLSASLALLVSAAPASDRGGRTRTTLEPVNIMHYFDAALEFGEAALPGPTRRVHDQRRDRLGQHQPGEHRPRGLQGRHPRPSSPAAIRLTSHSDWAGARAPAFKVMTTASLAPTSVTCGRPTTSIAQFPAGMIEARLLTYDGHQIHEVPLRLPRGSPCGTAPRSSMRQRRVADPDDMGRAQGRLRDASRAPAVIPFATGLRSDAWTAQFWFDYILLRTAGVGVSRNKLMAGEASYTDPEVMQDDGALGGAGRQPAASTMDANDQGLRRTPSPTTSWWPTARRP